MLEHDPNDDPFADLSAENDAKPLVSPLEFGSGAVDPTVKSDGSHRAEEDATEPTQDDVTSSEGHAKVEQGNKYE